jgi:hypothetical protein
MQLWLTYKHANAKIARCEEAIERTRTEMEAAATAAEAPAAAAAAAPAPSKKW